MGNSTNGNADQSSPADKPKAREQKKEKDTKIQSDQNVAAAKNKSKLGGIIDKLTRESKSEKKKKDKAWDAMKKDSRNQADVKGDRPADHLLSKPPNPDDNIKNFKPGKTKFETKGKRDDYGDPDKIDASKKEKKSEGIKTKLPGDRPDISAEEKAERSKIGESKGNKIYFGFDESTVPKATLDNWWKSQTKEFKESIKNKDSIIILNAYSSNPGEPGYNRELAKERNNTVKRFLIEKGADPKKIEIHAYGEDANIFTKPDQNKDDHSDRFVSVKLIKKSIPETSNTNPDKPKNEGQKKDIAGSDEAKKKGKESTEGLEMPEKPIKYTTEQGIKELPREVFLEMVLPPLLSLAKTSITYTMKLAEAIGECHDNNVKAAEIKAFANGISVLNGASTNLDNPHIREGRPYTKEEFYKAAKNEWNSDGIAANVIGRVEATKDADKAYKKITDKLTDTANQVLKMGKTPEQRQAVLGKYVKSTTKMFEDIVRKHKQKYE